MFRYEIASTSSFLTPMICTTCCRIPTTSSTNEGYWKGRVDRTRRAGGGIPRHHVPEAEGLIRSYTLSTNTPYELMHCISNRITPHVIIHGTQIVIPPRRVPDQLMSADERCTSSLKLSSNLEPQNSDLNPHNSHLKPYISNPTPKFSTLKPQTSTLLPPI